MNISYLPSVRIPRSRFTILLDPSDVKSAASSTQQATAPSVLVHPTCSLPDLHLFPFPAGQAQGQSARSSLALLGLLLS